MKTILVYALRGNEGYNGLFLSLLSEGRRRGWRFAWVDPDDREDAATERLRLAGVFSILKPAGFISGYIGNDSPVIPPMMNPCGSFIISNLPPARLRAGYSCPALVAVSRPVVRSRIPSQTVTNISAELLLQIWSFTSSRVCAGDRSPVFA